MNNDILDFIKWLFVNKLTINEETSKDYILALYGEYLIKK